MIAVVGNVGVLLDRLSDRSVEVEGICGALRHKSGDVVDLRDSDEFAIPRIDARVDRQQLLPSPTATCEHDHAAEIHIDAQFTLTVSSV